MSCVKDIDYLALSTRIHAMETRMLNRERMDRLIDARDSGEVQTVLAECGYGETVDLQSGSELEHLLTQARTEVFRDLQAAVPDPRVVQVFQLKYDYHNAKVLLKGEVMGTDAGRLLLAGGRYPPEMLADEFQRDVLTSVSPAFRQALREARDVLSVTHDPQRADVALDKAYFGEMAQLARECQSRFLEGYVRLSVDAANLRTAVRVARIGKGSDFLLQVLLPGGSVPEKDLAAVRGEDLGGVFPTGKLAKAAQLGAQAAKPAGGPLTAFERACDDAVTEYVSDARRVPFGEQTVIAYLYAKEAEFTALRTILSGRRAGLDGTVIRARLRETYV